MTASRFITVVAAVAMGGVVTGGAWQAIHNHEKLDGHPMLMARVVNIEKSIAVQTEILKRLEQRDRETIRAVRHYNTEQGVR